MKRSASAVLCACGLAGAWLAARAPLLAAPGEGTTAASAEAVPCLVPTDVPATIQQDERFRAGDEHAPVVLTLYACGRSDLCADVVPPLVEQVTTGRLKGKARLYLRPYFPTRTEGAEACGRAMTAAASQGMLWPYLLHLYAHRESFEQCLLGRWASLKGLDNYAFKAAYESRDTTALLEGVRAEAERNGVDTVPAAFVDGRRVRCPVTVGALVELLLHQHAQALAHPAAPAVAPDPAAGAPQVH
jgi:protein-disulfide isomerase